jgi:hypothetical protein
MAMNYSSVINSQLASTYSSDLPSACEGAYAQ